ncbi:MAG: Lrp/AsnC ligand binding domain-containing protein [Theionarchaea archaeon]|nr:Lrp/AsnC ligand binding domain-containing protein [Theionarchaea archaeon]
MIIKNSDTMVTAFVLLTSAPGKEEKVAEILKKDDMVTECHVVYGEYDVHLTVEMEDLHLLDEFIQRLRTMKGISHTATLIAVGD